MCLVLGNSSLPQPDPNKNHFWCNRLEKKSTKQNHDLGHMSHERVGVCDQKVVVWGREKFGFLILFFSCSDIVARYNRTRLMKPCISAFPYVHMLRMPSSPHMVLDNCLSCIHFNSQMRLI